MSSNQTLVQRLIHVVKLHRKPSSEKSISVVLKVMEKQILYPKFTVEDFKKDIHAALESATPLTSLVRQQHTEEELRECLTQLLIAFDAPEIEEVDDDELDEEFLADEESEEN